MAIILRKKYGNDFYYLKTGLLDIDFFGLATGEVIQVAYCLDNILSEGETESLIRTKRTIKEACLFRIITFEEEREFSAGEVSITVTPVWKFALENN